MVARYRATHGYKVFSKPTRRSTRQTGKVTELLSMNIDSFAKIRSMKRGLAL